MAATPTGPPVLPPPPLAPRGCAAALRLALLWAPLTVVLCLQLPGVFTNSESSDALKTLVFFGTVACCLLLQAGVTRLEGRRLHATSPSADLDLLRLVAIGIAVISFSVIATAFTGFEIVYET